MKTSADVTIWIGDDVTVHHHVTGGVHTIVFSGDETGRISVQFLDGLDGLVSFRDEISRVVADWVPPMPDEDMLTPFPTNTQPKCSTCLNGEAPGYEICTTCPTCKLSWPF